MNTSSGKIPIDLMPCDEVSLLDSGDRLYSDRLFFPAPLHPDLAHPTGEYPPRQRPMSVTSGPDCNKIVRVWHVRRLGRQCESRTRRLGINPKISHHSAGRTHQ